MLPFSKEELDYIARLDAEADCELLRRELPWLREAALRTLTISTMVLQVGCQSRLQSSLRGSQTSHWPCSLCNRLQAAADSDLQPSSQLHTSGTSLSAAVMLRHKQAHEP